MSMVLNMVGGGSGGEKPQIVATAPTGSTVTATKGIVTVSAPEVSGTWTFNLPSFGTWTVTATSGAESASDTIDVQQEYDTTLAYRPTASLTPTSGVTYTDGIATMTAEEMGLCGFAISLNPGITDTASVVYIDHGANHYKVSVGDSISLTVGGDSYPFVIVGFNHDELSDTTAYGTETATGMSGFTLQMKNCLATTYGMNPTATNAGGWDGCAFRATLQSTIKSTMDSEWQSAIKTVNKLTSAGNQSATILTSEDTLFIPSEVEVFGTIPYSKGGEGSQYAWYRAGNTKVKSIGGSATMWRERSPSTNANTSFAFVDSSGKSSTGNATAAIGMAFAMCI